MSSDRSSSDPNAGGQSAAFERLEVRVRQWVWQRGWTELRDIQEQAIEALTTTDRDVLIAAGTASGKTEAAFLPICSRLAEQPARGVRALYVGPLKALINDQFARLDELCAALEIPVHRWHGDVGRAKKLEVLRGAGGILLITPESLEALFVRQGYKLPELFAGLQHVVVDEVHAFLDNERGRQLQSLLHRTEVAIARRVPRVGLSATIGDMSLAAEYLRPRAGATVQVIVSSSASQEIRLQLRGYVRPVELPAPRSEEPAEAEAAEEAPTEDEIDIARHLFQVLRGRNNLVFANSRTKVERFADLLRGMCERARVPNEFWPHHGSLSAEIRHDVESTLKAGDRPVTAVCTSTLEMGIDIGAVATTAQIGAPPSVSALRQRLGRSGRRGEPATMRLYACEAALSERSPPQDTLHPELVQSVAMLQLLLARWCEPPRAGALHLSTLVQQVLSSIAEHGGARAQELWKRLCGTGPWQAVDAATFAQLLRALGGNDLVVQSGDGTLLLGVAGERVVNHHSFYAAFATPEEYRLMHGGRALGRLVSVQPVGEGTYLIFAGRRWRVVGADEERRVIDVVPSAAGRVPMFTGGTGAPVHDRVRQEMKAVLQGDVVPAYLDARAQTLLSEARDYFRRFGLAERSVLPAADGSLLFPWKGDRALYTAAMQLQAAGFDATVDGIAVHVDAAPTALAHALRQLADAGPADASSLARRVEIRDVGKFGEYLSEELVVEDFARSAFDVEGAWRLFQEVAATEAATQR